MIVAAQLSLILFFAITTAAMAFQSGIVLLAPVMFIFIVVPFFDWILLKLGKTNLFQVLNSQPSRATDLPLYFYCVLHFVSLGIFILAVKNDDIGTIVLKALAALMFHGGAAVVHGHELGHRKSNVAKFLGNLCLASFSYGHFTLEHIQGHHKKAATPEDPSSAQWGESLWAFLPRTIFGQIRSAIKLEKNNIKSGKWNFATSAVIGWGFWIILVMLSYQVSGLPGLIFILSYSLFAILLLEAGNYVEHYGLNRKFKGSRFEKFESRHSWTSEAPLTNIILFNLPFHSSHHINSNYLYLELINEPKAPKLPYGHFAMLLIAAVPPLWYKIIHPIIENHVVKE